ncbi:hypothetical protein [Helicobacter suis]|uniref:hypothetical protein n=1 Tax=Helicobacter suis TaxID=104628 RepID=UPI001F0770B5|nr:hypothetical protein [Helicobacter suis]
MSQRFQYKEKLQKLPPHNHKNNIIALLLIFLSLNLDSHELPAFVRAWQGIYKTEWLQKGQKIQMAFLVSDNCYANDADNGMGKFYCEIGYSKNGSFFDNSDIDFYTEKPNQMEYSTVRILDIQSPKKAIIKVYSMEYSNDFCHIVVKKYQDRITLKSGKRKLKDFVLHKDIFHTYTKQTALKTGY